MQGAAGSAAWCQEAAHMAKAPGTKVFVNTTGLCSFVGQAVAVLMVNMEVTMKLSLQNEEGSVSTMVHCASTADSC